MLTALMPSYSFYNDKSIGGVQRECTSSGELVGFAVYRNVTVPGDPDKCDTKAFRKKFDLHTVKLAIVRKSFRNAKLGQ